MPKPQSSIDRPLALRLRPELVAVRVEMSGATTWLVKDPVTLEHFQFTAEEYALMDWLREPVSIAELRRLFARRFPPQTISPQSVWEFLCRLHDAGLLISEGAGQGRELLARARREQTRRWALAWTSLLAIRLRGVDPDAFLSAVHKRIRWLFSPTVTIAAIAVSLYALWLVFGHFDEFRARVPELSALADPRNLPWLLLALGAVKVLHELGHALVCKHFGGEVRELGFMLLLFAPCLYCDVSDAWRIRSKWRRIAVSAAGMIVELSLAAAATIVWWYARPGVVQLVALNVMIIGTVNTLLVNGNPLLRYDGYYILSDLTEIPNLWQRSREVLRRLTSGWLFARPAAGADDPLLPARHRLWLALYAIASKAYLMVIVVLLLWGLVVLLYPHHLQNLAYAVGMTMVASSLVGPVMGAVRLARNPVRRAELRQGRLSLVLALGLAAAIAVLMLPVNYYVRAPLVLMPEDAARVYATTEGTLATALPAGRQVKRGETIGKLANAETELELARLDGEHRLRQLRVEHLQLLRGLDREANDQLPTARAALADSQRRLAEVRREARRLTLTAPVDGIVIPAPRSAPSAAPELRLATWSGTLLDATNAGAHVKPGTLICLVGDPSRIEAVLLIDDTDVKRLQRGQRARLRIEQLPGQVMEGEIVDVARHDVRNADSAASGQADLASLFAGAVSPEHRGALYQARVQFDSPDEQLLVIGGRGEAKVTAERITVGRRILRYFAQTFRLPM
jgi:putative peptide zinc metalloprotease protein